MVAPTIGVLALQGAFAAHIEVLTGLGCATLHVRTRQQLLEVDALVLPGGESTTMSMLLERAEMIEPLKERAQAGLPIFATCAGLILLAAEITDGRPDQHALGVLDISVARNFYGTQIDSFEIDIDVDGLSEAFHAIFIRSPDITRLGVGVEALATVDGAAVLCRQGQVMAAAFHPELSKDPRLHQQWLNQCHLSPN